MKNRFHNWVAAFTLLEVMLSISILSVVLAAIYSSWMGIIRAKEVAVEAAATVQRERMAMQVIQEALGAAQLFVANAQYYGFSNDVHFGEANTFSFVAQLPEAFPRSGKFGAFDVRRVTFAVESGGDRLRQLVMRQNPILMDMDEDEQVHPVVLARNVKQFKQEYWDTTTSDWIEEWVQTNQLPKLVRITLQLNYGEGNSIKPGEVVTRVIGLPTAGVQPGWQVPSLGNSATSNNTGLRPIRGVSPNPETDQPRNINQDNPSRVR